MSQQGFHKKISSQLALIASKFSSSSKSQLTADTESTTDISAGIQNTAKILIIGETGSGKLVASFCCFKTKHTYLTIHLNDCGHRQDGKILPLNFAVTMNKLC
jgi:midasin (ATPase involved in ribosome maturation)